MFAKIVQFVLFYFRFVVMRFIVACLLFSGLAKAQGIKLIKVEPKTTATQILNKDEFVYTDSALNTIFLNLHSKGYFSAYIDSSETKSTNTTKVICGEPAKWLDLNICDAVKAEVPKYNLKPRGIFSVDAYATICKQMLNYYQNNGYPFAQIYAEQINATKDHVSLTLCANKGRFIQFDSLITGGNANISYRFLKHYLNIKKGDSYNEKIIGNINAKLSALPYLQVTAPAAVYFYGNKATPFVYVNNKPSNVFNAVVGLAPNSAINNKLVVTGEADLILQNIKGSGKLFRFNYRSFLVGSQDLQLQFSWPYFLNTKLGLDYQFKLLKFDTSYLDIANVINLQYLLSGNNYIKLFYQRQQVSLITADTLKLVQTKQLPAFNDVLNQFYGIGIRLASLDYAPNPTKGYVLEAETAIGFRQIIKNSTINAVNLSSTANESYSIYDSLNLNTLQFKSGLTASIYVPLKFNFVWFNQVQSGIVNTPNLFVNDLYRIGGLKTLRGFDEQSIFADKFVTINSELRYLLNKDANMLAFYNMAFVENTPNRLTDKPMGLGLGLNIATTNGNFSLFYAVGKQSNNSFNFNSAKIHFGYTNYF